MLPPFPDNPINSARRRMEQFELYYRKPLDQSFQPRYLNNHKPSGSTDENTAQRILTLYYSGQSIESITKQLGRARHFVVHVLQSKGVFGQQRSGYDSKGSTSKPSVTKELMEEVLSEKGKQKRPIVKRHRTESVVDEPSEKAKLPITSTPGRKSKSILAAKTKLKPSSVEEMPTTGQWSPPMLDALHQILGQQDIKSDMSLEEVQKMVLKSRR
jgi:hypothetical protein